MSHKLSLYFRHDQNARHDHKIKKLILKKGFLGYAWYWVIIEMLRETTAYELKKDDYEVIADECKTSPDEIKAVIEDFELFEFNGETFHSERLTRDMQHLDEIHQRYSESGRKGGRASQAQATLKPGLSSKVSKESKESNLNNNFETIWAQYPNKDGRKQAERHFSVSVKNDQDWLDIKKALENYLKSENVLRGYVKNGSTWFNNWRDWINYTAPVKTECQQQRDKPRQSQVRHEPKPSPSCTNCKGTGKFTDGQGKELDCWCIA